ncbi:MAG: fatty acid hydroxylase, partial [Phaeodactylibacter sp.]|nr:fatty acid hydroxylase [Phaeodactylibacter sp.]
VGISIYGLIYFLIHDVYIHRRFKWFRQLDSTYSRAILRAHGAHHAKQSKEKCESFGLLWVHPKYFKKRSEWATK